MLALGSLLLTLVACQQQGEPEETALTRLLRDLTTSGPTATPPFFPAHLQDGEAEIDIFSGRPNPQWRLSAEQSADLKTEVELLVPASMPPPPTQLGYRGIYVNLGSEDSGDALAIWAHDSSVVLWEGEDVFYLADEDRAVERYLVELSEPHIDSEVYTTILAEFQ